MGNNINGIVNIKLWPFMPLVVTWSVLDLLLRPQVNHGFSDFLFDISLYLFVLLWICIQLSKHEVGLSGISKTPAEIPWRHILFFVPLTKVTASILLMTLGVGIVYLFPSLLDMAATSNSTETPLLPMEVVYRFLLVIVIGPIAEEYFFRGVMLNKWKIKFGLFRGLLLTSLVFAVIHPLSFIGAFLMSMLFSILYLKTERMLVAIIAHAFGNLIVFLTELFVLPLFGTDTDGAQSVSEVPTTGHLIAASSLALLFLAVTVYGLYKIYPKKNRKAFNPI
ncbi:CPBP family intramembrane glutamic endopeptidase [Planomicrobium sp. CPCC 101079]|uniref:CPBP family intramembrane glutamic endopeptidase n=1 Tax=Planomicrobium sp. CPCC 101079 TaxID=2599618 RepID=UPI0011B56EBE|nr:type II CAAX endopeptidase family protein [Planomicrobium sp. CPCC 101079]TWT13172.1 CPBP family intramembrane metalloprotease [Planomicrobium sp. CPCC 101079]